MTRLLVWYTRVHKDSLAGKFVAEVSIDAGTRSLRCGIEADSGQEAINEAAVQAVSMFRNTKPKEKA